MKTSLGISTVVVILVLAASLSALPPKKYDTPDFSSMIDNETYIDANNILMFVTNHGNFGRDLSGVFGHDYGTFYPYIGYWPLYNGVATMSPLYAAGIWLGGVNNGDTLMAVSEYASEYVPGPMYDGTFQPDHPTFRVFRLFADSLESNPNADYLEWPVNQGAPVDGNLKPIMKGDQMCWTVFNDADPSSRASYIDPGNTSPMGIEIRQTMWAADSEGDFDVPYIKSFTADHIGPNAGRVVIYPKDPAAFTGHDYMVVFEEISPGEIVWHLVDVTLDVRVLENQTNFSGDDNYAVVDGLQVKVYSPPNGIIAINEVANSGGIVDPPHDVMFAPNTSSEWRVAETSPGSSDFDRLNWRREMEKNDWEIRFTASGSNYYLLSTDELQVDRVPFEAWNIGSGTPDDDSDDIRLHVQFIDNDFNGHWNWGDRIYLLELPYSEPAPAFLPAYEPVDQQIGRIVFEQLSGVALHPEVGTVVRFETDKDVSNTPADTFSFTSPLSGLATVGGEGNAVYIAYELRNKGTKNFTDFYFSLWADPDLGFAGDDLVGCDTLTSTFFCYNAGNDDQQYGALPPACGFRFLVGPMVPSGGDSAIYGNQWIQNYRNLKMTSMGKYINGTDPNSFRESYAYMAGLDGDPAQPYIYDGHVLRYMHSGDPVTGTGDLDIDASDRRMMGSCGPFDFAVGDSQYVLIKFAIGHGENRLQSIAKLRELLGTSDILLDAPEGPTTLPDVYSLSVNYPNPFNPSTTIEYNLPRKSHVTLELFNVLGQKVRTLVNQTESPGKYSALWDGTNEENEAVASGIYFYRLRAEEFSQTRKMMLLK